MPITPMKFLLLLGLLFLSLPSPAPADPAGPFTWGEKTHMADAGWGRMIPLSGRRRWLCVDTLYPRPNSILQVEVSEDNARTWTPLATVAEPGRNLDNGEVTQLPGGVLLLTGRSVVNNQSFHLPVSRSVDGGKTWAFLSQIDTSDRVIQGNRPSQGLWEPHFFRLPGGHVAVAYANEKHSVETPPYSQVCSERVSPDGGRTWGPEITLAAQTGGGGQRPGMPVVTRMTNGQYIAVYEVVGVGNADVYSKTSRDGVQWPPGIGTPIPGHHAGPWVTSLTDGRLVVSSCSNQISYSNDFGATWLPAAAAWDYGQTYTWPALYQTGPDEIAAMTTKHGVEIRWGRIQARALDNTGKPTEPTTGAAPRTIKAQDFLDTFGVNVHFGQNNYRNVQAMADALNILGFSRVRGTCESAADVAAWKDLAAKASVYFPTGLKADVLVTGYLNAPDITLAGQQALIPRIAGLIETIEGPNEINNVYVGHGTHGPTDFSDQTAHFAANSVAWSQALAQWQQRTPALSPVTLLAPSIASGAPQDYARLPDISPFVGAGNIHFYAGNGRQPSGFGGGNFAAICRWYQTAATPGKHLAVTECGQTTAGRPGQGGCDEATQAKYVLNQIFDATAMGIYRAYFYQLMDDTPDGDPTGSGGAESHFGLFDYRWRVKPAAQAIANVKNLLADTSRTFTAKVPAYRVSGVNNPGASGSSLSISKSDGTTVLVVWNEPPMWDAKTNAAVTPPADPVTVDFGGDYSYRVYDPLVGLSAIASGRGSRVGVNVLGAPILIQIRPAPPGGETE